MENTFALNFSPRELAYIGRFLNLPVPLAEDPAGMEESELLKMIERGYIRYEPGEDPEIALDQTVVAMMAVLAFPDSALIAETIREQDVEPETWRLCVAHGLIVDQHEESPEGLVLTACRARDVAIERALNHLDLRKQPSGQAGSWRIAAEDMAQVPYIIAGNGREDGAAFLRDKGLPEKVATRLASALDNPVQQSLIQALTWNDGVPHEVGRLTLLEEVYGLWLIVPVQEEDGSDLEIISVSIAEVIERLHELAYRVLPPEVESSPT